MPKFSDSPYFLLDEYFSLTEPEPIPEEPIYQADVLFKGYYNGTGYIFVDPVVFDEVFIDDGVVFVSYDVDWNSERIVEETVILNSYLIGPTTHIKTTGNGLVTVYVKVEDYGFSPAKLKVDSIEDNTFHFTKYDIFESGTLSGSISGGEQKLFDPGETEPATGAASGSYPDGPSYQFDIYTLDSSLTTIESGQEVYFRKDSFFHNWLNNGATNHLLDVYGQDFDIRKFINTDRQYILFGKIYSSVGEDAYDIIFNGMKDYTTLAVPYHQRTERLKELFKIYFDQIYHEIYNQQKDIWSLIDPMEIDIRWLDYLATYYDVDNIIDDSQNTQRQREFVRDLVYALKRKGTYAEYYVLWKILTGTGNFINIYEWWHNKEDISVGNTINESQIEEYLYLNRDEYHWSPSAIGGAGEYWYMVKDNALDYPSDYSEGATGEMLSTHYRVEADINVEPVTETEVFPQGVADNFYDMCTLFKPVGRYAHQSLVFSPLTDYSGSPVSLYDSADQEFNSLVLTTFLGVELLEPDAYIHIQTSPSATWEFEHDLGNYDVLIQCYDNGLNEIIPLDTEFNIDGVTVRLSFDSPTAGFALLIKADEFSIRGEPFVSANWTIRHSILQKEVFAQFGEYQNPLQYTFPNDIELVDTDEVKTTSNDTTKLFGNIREPDEIIMVYVPTASDTWNLNHSFGKQGVLVSYFDNNDNRIYPKNSDLVDDNNILATWEEAQAGYALIIYIGDLVDRLSQLSWKVADDENSSSSNYVNIKQTGIVTSVYTDDTYDYVDFELPINDEYNITKIGLFSRNDTILYHCKCDNLYKKGGVKYDIHFRIRKQNT